MWIAVVALLLQSKAPPRAPVAAKSAERCVAITGSPDERVGPPPKLAPGPPPLLSFRYYEGQLHHRYANMDLMLDDAGH